MTTSGIHLDAGENALLSRFRGCLLGGALGDALGYPIEFRSLPEIREMHHTPPVRIPCDRFGLAVVSDDTQMTPFTAEGMIRAHQRFRDRGICSPQDVLLHAYLRWYNTQADEGRLWGGRGCLVDDPRLRVRRAPGNTCLSALSELMRVIPSNAEKRPNDSKGCGAVMRAAPIGLGMRDRQAAFELGRDAGRLTHGHPLGFLSSAFLASVVHDVARGTALPTAIRNASAMTRRERGGKALLEAADRASLRAGNGKPDAPTVAARAWLNSYGS
jgi:ADP-ribosylglycohydrolase